MALLSIGALGIFWMQYFVIAPEAYAIIEELKMVAGDESGDKKELALEFAGRLEELLKFRKWTVLYPALVVILIGTYRDTISGWLETKAPDEGWE